MTPLAGAPPPIPFACERPVSPRLCLQRIGTGCVVQSSSFSLRLPTSVPSSEGFVR
jgi:hypothetical protein